MGVALDDVIKPAFVVELAGLVAAILGFFAFTIALENVLDPYFLDSDLSLLVLRSGLVLVGLGVLATSYAAWRGYDLPVARPSWTDGGLLGAGVATAVLLAVLPFVPLALQTGVEVSHVTATLADLGGVFGPRTLIRVALFVAGMPLLYHGLVQGALQRVFPAARDRAVAVTTLLGGYLVTPTVGTYGTFADGPWLYLWGNRAAVAVLFVVALGVAVYAVERTSDARVHALALVPVVATLALAGLVLALEADSPAGVLLVLTRAAVVGVAAYAFDRTASLVTPTFVYATFALVTTVLSSAALAVVVGA